MEINRGFKTFFLFLLAAIVDHFFLFSLKQKMERQYLRANPSNGQCPQQIPDALLFERWGDDNTLYFQDSVQHLLVGSGPAPLGLDQPGKNRDEESIYTEAKYIATGTMQSAHLDSELGFVKQSFVLAAGNGTLKMFLDAWLPYQTVPITVTATKLGASGGQYSWKFENYVPIGGCASKYGNGIAQPCPNLMEAAPIIRTLGHTNRSPIGEFPVSQATKAKTCYCDEERPVLYFTNIAPPGSSPIQVTVSIGV